MAGIRFFWVIALGLVLSGCVMVPGSNVDLGKQAPANDAAVDLSDKLNVQAITPELLVRLKEPLALPDANTDLDKAMHDYQYRVGPGDVLNVTVWDHPEFTNPSVAMRLAPDLATTGGNGADAGARSSAGFLPGSWVDVDGTLYFPYVGVVKVAGMKVQDVRELIRQKLSRFFPEPQVDVTIIAYRAQHIYVTGEVRAPGTLPLTNIPLTLLDAVNQAGGVLPSADWKDVVVTRQGREYHYSLRDLYRRGDTRQNTLLLPNDLVFVPRTDNNKVFVLGEVKQTRAVPMTPNGLSLAEALTESGGISELTANASGIFVLRRDTTQGSGKLIDVFQLNAHDATALILADSFPLKERDIIYVTAAPVARWNRIIGQLLPTLDGLYLGAQAGHAGLF